jgi:hypothetical protein
MPIQVRGNFYYLGLSENSVLEDLMVNHLWNLGVQIERPRISPVEASNILGITARMSWGK